MEGVGFGPSQRISEGATLNSRYCACASVSPRKGKVATGLGGDTGAGGACNWWGTKSWAYVDWALNGNRSKSLWGIVAPCTGQAGHSKKSER